MFKNKYFIFFLITAISAIALPYSGSIGFLVILIGGMAASFGLIKKRPDHPFLMFLVMFLGIIVGGFFIMVLSAFSLVYWPIFNCFAFAVGALLTYMFASQTPNTVIKSKNELNKAQNKMGFKDVI